MSEHTPRSPYEPPAETVTLERSRTSKPFVCVMLVLIVIIGYFPAEWLLNEYRLRRMRSGPVDKYLTMTTEPVE